MRVLQVHNRYLSGVGGEDASAKIERELLARKGHEVLEWQKSNEELSGSGAGLFARALGAVCSPSAYRELKHVVDAKRPDVVHVHNTFAAMSPSIFWAAGIYGGAVVHTLHNYRALCATALLARNDKPCEECVGALPWPALAHRCRYRGSRALGGLVMATRMFHSVVGTYRSCVDAFIVLSEFQRQIFTRAGFPAEKIVVKPNCTPDLAGKRAERRTGRMAFVGRVTAEKGVDLLLSAARKVHLRELVVLGDGPNVAQLQEQYGREGVVFAGRVASARVREVVAESDFLVMPSRCYEGMPNAVLEALMLGTPVIVPRHGPFPEMITEGISGLFFRPGDVGALVGALEAAIALDDGAWRKLCQGAREAYVNRYRPEENYRALLAVYEAARTRRAARR